MKFYSQIWLELLVHSIDEDIAVMHDQPTTYLTKIIIDPLGGIIPDTAYNLTCNFSSMGLTISFSMYPVGSKADLGFWCYHDFIDWSVFFPGGKISFRFSVYESGPGSKRLDFVLRTAQAHNICTTLEFYIEKYKSFMSLMAEIDYLSKFLFRGRGNYNDSCISSHSQIYSSCYIPLTKSLSDLSDYSIAPSMRFCGTGGLNSSSINSIAEKSKLSLKSRIKQGTWLKDFMLRKEGSLFDDLILQVGGRVIVDGAVVEMNLFYRNHGVVDINDLDVIFSAPEKGYFLEVKNSPRADLSPSGVAKQVVVWTCFDACFCSPRLQISYTNTASGNRHVESIILPVTALSLMKPWRLTASEFLAHWEALNVKSFEISKVYQTSTPMNHVAIMAALQEVSVLSHLSLLFTKID